MICGAFRKIRPGGEFLFRDDLPGCTQPVFLTPAEYLRHLYRPASPWHSFSPATVIRREAFELAGGYRRELGFWTDSFTCRVAGLRWGMVYFPEDCMCFRVMPQSLATLENQDAARIQQIIVRAQELMRQRPYAELFPARYVRWWGRRAWTSFRQAKFFAQSADMDRGFALIVHALQELPPGSPPTARLSAWLCRKALSILFRLARRLVVWNRLAERRRHASQ
jgi:hypothetical protein